MTPLLLRPRRLPTTLTPIRTLTTTPPLPALRPYAPPAARLLDDDPTSDKTRILREFIQPTSASHLAHASARTARQSLADLAAATERAEYAKRNRRPWERGQVYAPRDLGPTAQARWRPSTMGTRGNAAEGTVDFVDDMGFNPLDNYRNFALISENMTAFGRIQSGRATGLRPVNQRKMAKAIRRAVGMGIHPSVHLHPEVLLHPVKHVNHGVLPTIQLPPKSGKV
ncbi:hypothetical protein QBC39DRAFT_351017 [Podospora conica]|nr:hypothetical protein QBC39DRAFT_351017 [Schizothecium conicum]